MENRLIRTIGNAESRFLEDHLRMLRAVRFTVQLGFDLEKVTEAAIIKHAPLILRTSSERIRDEFCKIMTSPSPAKGIQLLDRTGLLHFVLPDLETLKGVEQPKEYHPEGDVWIHTMMVLEGLSNAPIELAMGALLHDIAKPKTFVQAVDRIRFHGHDKLGAEMARKICRRLAFPNAQTDVICSLVSEHLKFKDVFQMRQSKLKRFLSIERFDLHLELHRLDCLASHKNLEAYEYCKNALAKIAEQPPLPHKLISGDDLLSLGCSPGKRIGEILRAVEDAILEGNVVTRDEAIRFVKERFLNRGEQS